MNAEGVEKSYWVTNILMAVSSRIGNALLFTGMRISDNMHAAERIL